MAVATVGCSLPDNVVEYTGSALVYGQSNGADISKLTEFIENMSIENGVTIHYPNSKLLSTLTRGNESTAPEGGNEGGKKHHRCSG
jgi:hypothetical protein